MIEDILAAGHPKLPLLFEGDSASVLMSRIIQRYLCISQDSCGTCPGCKKFSKGYHPDWISLQGDSNMEDTRRALASLRQKPLEAALKIFSIFDLGQTSLNIQNALLKTLEEPSLHWIIFISSQSRWTVIETVRSRCLILRVPSHEQKNLSVSEKNIFELSKSGDEIQLFPAIDSWLKERNKTKNLFKNLLTEASRQKYPGHWRFLAEPMSLGLADLNRNIHPKTVWDHIWTQSHK